MFSEKGKFMGFGPAIVEKDGKKVLHHISSSQVSTYESCPYRWYAEKVEGSPQFADWSWAQAGVAAHEILEEQINNYIGKETGEKRILDPKVQEEAEELISWFRWEDYFIDHEIVDTEMDMVLNLGDDLPVFVGSADVVSIDDKGIVTVTDWKTGYGADKGVDIQTQSYSLAIMENMGVDEVVFRRVYPRLRGEEKGTCKVEQYLVLKEDANRYLTRIKFLAKKMKETAEGEIDPKITASDSCVHCSIAYRCPATKNFESFEPKELVEKRKIFKAALAQIENSLKKIAEKDDILVGDERYGFRLSSYIKSKNIKGEELNRFLAQNNEELLIKKAKISIDEGMKEYLESQGFEGFQTVNKKTFAFLNEKELKEQKKEARKSQSTVGEKSSA